MGKRQVRREKVAFSKPANGFASCEQPAALQAIRDSFVPSSGSSIAGPVIPLPLTSDDKNAGYFWDCRCTRSRFWPNSTTAGNQLKLDVENVDVFSKLVGRDLTKKAAAHSH